MRGGKIAYLYLAMAMLLIIAAGCKRIPLYERSTKINLVVDLEMGLDYDIELSYETPFSKEYQAKIDGVAPEYYEVLVYDINTNELKSTHIVGEKGGSLSLFPGNYHLVVYSFGTESTQVKDLHHRQFAQAYTTDITDLKSGILKSMSSNMAQETKSVTKTYEDDPIITEPDHLYVGNKMDVFIEAFQGREEEITIYTTAASILDTYSLEVLNIKGAENIEKVEAFVTGQIVSNYFGRPERNYSPATLYVEMTPDVQNQRLYTVFNTFGKLPGAENKIFLDITVTDSGGGQYRYIYDVTDQFDDPGNTDNQLIIDGGIIDIPEAEQGGGGFQPSVDDWDHEDIDVPLG